MNDKSSPDLAIKSENGIWTRQKSRTSSRRNCDGRKFGHGCLLSLMLVILELSAGSTSCILVPLVRGGQSDDCIQVKVLEARGTNNLENT